MRKTSVFAAMLLCVTMLVAQNKQVFQFPFVKSNSLESKTNELEAQTLPSSLIKTAEGTIRFRTNQNQSVVLPLQGDVTYTDNSQPYKTYYKYDQNQNITECYEQYLDGKPKYQLKCQYQTLTEGDYAGRVVMTLKEVFNFQSNSGSLMISTCDNKGMPLLEELSDYRGSWKKRYSREAIVNSNGVRTGIKIDGVEASAGGFDELGRTKDLRFTSNGVEQFIRVTWDSDGLPSEICVSQEDYSQDEGPSVVPMSDGSMSEVFVIKAKIDKYVRKSGDLNIWSLLPLDAALSSDLESNNINDHSLIDFSIVMVDQTGILVRDMGRTTNTYNPLTREIVQTFMNTEGQYINKWILEADGKGYTSIEDARYDNYPRDKYRYHRYNTEGLLVDDYYEEKTRSTDNILYAQGNQYEYQYQQGDASKVEQKKSYSVRLNYNNNNTLDKTLYTTELYNYTPWTQPPFVVEEKNLSITIQGSGVCLLGGNSDTKFTSSFTSKVMQGSSFDLDFNPKMNNQFKSIKVNGVDKTGEVSQRGAVSYSINPVVEEDLSIVIDFEAMQGDQHDVKVVVEGEGTVFVDDQEIANNTVLKVTNGGFIPYRYSTKFDYDSGQQQTYLQSLTFAGTEINLYTSGVLTPINQAGEFKFVFLPNIVTNNTIVYAGEPVPQGLVSGHTSSGSIAGDQFTGNSGDDVSLFYDRNRIPDLVLSKMEINDVDVTDQFIFSSYTLSLKRGVLSEPTNTIRFTFKKKEPNINVSITVHRAANADPNVSVVLNNTYNHFYFQEGSEQTQQINDVEKSYNGWDAFVLLPYGNDFYTPSNKVVSLMINGVERVTEIENKSDRFPSRYAVLLKQLPDNSTIHIYYEIATSIKTLEFDAKVYVQDNQLFVEGLEGSNTIELYSSNGLLLENRASTSRNERFKLPTKGLYLLKIGKAVCKIQY